MSRTAKLLLIIVLSQLTRETDVWYQEAKAMLRTLSDSR